MRMRCKKISSKERAVEYLQQLSNADNYPLGDITSEELAIEARKSEAETLLRELNDEVIDSQTAEASVAEPESNLQ